MELKNIENHIRTLATLNSNYSPLISCYLNLEKGKKGYRSYLKDRTRLLQSSQKGLPHVEEEFEDALNKVESFIKKKLLPETKGVAIFSRGEPEPFFLPLQFRVPLPNSMTVDMTPNIYHLVELKDVYHRYVVLIASEENARILEVNLGEVTSTLWLENQNLLDRVKQIWSKEHYQHHRHEQTNKFIKEKIKVLDQLMSQGGYSHLILVGNPKMTARIKKSLPKHLSEKLIETLAVSTKAKLESIVETTLSMFIRQEQQDSLSVVELLKQYINTEGPAVIGTQACREAIERGQADMLILSKELEYLHDRDELVKLAVKHKCRIETVSDSFTLMQYGGVGCLLRYRLPDQMG
ncbi:MAG: host attachment protein [SAR324 cluster bacterium]|nr:host attachment protein [SAR324 cluster bacterium]